MKEKFTGTIQGAEELQSASTGFPTKNRIP